MFIYTILVTYLYLFATPTFAQRSCKTPDGLDGRCVDRSRCLILNSRRTDASFVRYLESSRCFLSNLVCCFSRYISSSVTSSYRSTNRRDTELNGRSCGEANRDKISNGNDTFLGEFPFMALLGYRSSKGIEFRCGGSLITPRYVLTAAHCINNDLKSVRLGENTLDKEPDCRNLLTGTQCAPPVKDIKIEEKIPHSEFKSTHKINDIALLRLSESVSLENKAFINTVCLPIDNRLHLNPRNSRLMVAGWGLIDGTARSKLLQKAILPRQSTESCKQVYKLTKITESNTICAGGENLVGTCHGDSGGPIFWIGRVNQGTKYIQYGVTGAGFKFCGEDFKGRTLPSVYTSVANYIGWIRSNMR